ncbi:M20 aminoacylase family protein [Pelagibacterium halotolerans]|uniref:N-acetyl-L,L-diaminopimelate deacetylase n=1 Tax=Pelagibacterium halotolerans (strain DSM 22347 / JCM 15775 / CGMCC 1.7692 / B2) TaxID=1082931 RepID=G4RAA9_PELHB|nr:M20 aminoacylase family protein [Pelagibacterium halotolerans]AEQ50468.1 N-acetyl-L,L-diaminopimelate deacetylase [Pelagibacterium halotolerans B2]QJR19571.1 amidohydrolase [Pelagibacterium halotolerans]SDZ87703.1 hippurate hydrolase [Pelagibacterium halotolerans]
MPIINRVAEFHADIAAWRQHLHANPELLYDVHETAGFVSEQLKAFGVDEVVTGIGRTGVVGVIRGKGDSDRVVGLRADMDALPITERTGKSYASGNTGKMHACGHDGHTAMLLGAARYLAETRNFDGTVIVIFQPAEEGGGGGRLMVEDGLMERFGISQVFGMHNMPGIPLGEFAIRTGGIMAGTDQFAIDIEGHGGHAAMPHLAVDPVIVSAHIISGLQTLVSRSVDPIRSAVLSVTTVNAGTAYNVIPRTARLTGTVRTLDEDVRAQMEEGIKHLAPQLARAFGASATVKWMRGYPVTVNAPEQTVFAAEVAREIVGEERVNDAVDPTMGGEDFAYMLNARPGSYIFLGNGDSADLHTDTYDFNDEAIPMGVSYWVRLAERALAAQ